MPRDGSGPGTQQTPRRRLVRVAWFIGLWAAGVLALGTVAMVIRAALGTG